MNCGPGKVNKSPYSLCAIMNWFRNTRTTSIRQQSLALLAFANNTATFVPAKTTFKRQVLFSNADSFFLDTFAALKRVNLGKIYKLLAFQNYHYSTKIFYHTFFKKGLYTVVVVNKYLSTYGQDFYSQIRVNSVNA